MEKLGDSAVFLVLWRSRAAEFLLLHVMPYTKPAWLHARIICITAFCALCQVSLYTANLKIDDIIL